MKKRKWIAILTVVLALAGAALVAAKGKDKGDPRSKTPPSGSARSRPKTSRSPSARSAWSTRSPRWTSSRPSPAASSRCAVREGAVVKVGDVLAEIEPDVNQAQSLSDVQASVKDAELKLQDAERELAMQKTLFDQGLIGARRLPHRPRSSATWRRENLRAAQMRYQIVEDRGIPISGNAASQKARVTSADERASSSRTASSSARR